MIAALLLWGASFGFSEEDALSQEEVIEWAFDAAPLIQDTHGRGTQFAEVSNALYGRWPPIGPKDGWPEVRKYLAPISQEDALEIARKVLKPTKNQFVHLGLMENLQSSYRNNPLSKSQLAELSRLLREYVEFHLGYRQERSRLDLALSWHLAFISEVLQSQVTEESEHLEPPEYSNQISVAERIFENSDLSEEKPPDFLSWDESLDGRYLFTFHDGLQIALDTETGQFHEKGKDQDYPSWIDSKFDAARQKMQEDGEKLWLAAPHAELVVDDSFAYQLYSPPPHDKGRTRTQFFRYDRKQERFEELKDQEKYPFLKYDSIYERQLLQLGSGRLVVTEKERYHPHSVTRVFVADTLKNEKFTERFTTEGTFLLGAEDSDELWIFRPRADGRGQLGRGPLAPAIPDSMTIYHAKENRFELGFQRKLNYPEQVRSDLLGPPLTPRWNLPEEVLTPKADKLARWWFFEKETEKYLLEATLRVGWEDRWRWKLYRLASKGGEAKLLREIVLAKIGDFEDLNKRLDAPEVLIQESGFVFVGPYGVWKFEWNNL